MPGMNLIHRLSCPALALGLVAGCDVALGPGREVTLVIMEVEAPAEVPPGTTFMVRVTVQSGGCRSFDALVVTQTTEQVTIVARGHDASGPGISCTGDIRHTERDVRVDPPLADPFTVVARQPSGPPTTQVVRVR